MTLDNVQTSSNFMIQINLREDIKKKTADLVKIASFTLPPSAPNERVKNKE